MAENKGGTLFQRVLDKIFIKTQQNSYLKPSILLIAFVQLVIMSCIKHNIYERATVYDLDPDKIFRRGNYIMDRHIDKFTGTWASDEFTMSIIKEYRLQYERAYWDLGKGQFTVKTNDSLTHYDLTLNSYSETVGSLHILGVDDIYRITIDPTDQKVLRLSKIWREKIYITPKGEKRKTYPSLPKEIILTRVY